MSFVNAQGKRSRPRHQGHLSSSEIGRLLHTHGGAGPVVRFQARKARQSSGDTLYGAKSKSEGVRFWQVPRQAQTRRVEASQSRREKMVRLEDRRREAPVNLLCTWLGCSFVFKTRIRKRQCFIVYLANVAMSYPARQRCLNI